MDDEVGEDKDHQQAERRHRSAHPPELTGQSGNGELHPIHVFVNPAAGDYFELLVGIVELLQLVPRYRSPGQRGILQAVEPGQPLIETAIELAIGDGVAVLRQQHPITIELLLVAGETAAIPQHRETAQGAFDIDGLRRQQGGAAGILDRPLHLVAGELTEVGKGGAVVPDHAAQRHQHQHKSHQYHLQQGAWANLGHHLFSCILTGAPA